MRGSSPPCRGKVTPNSLTAGGDTVDCPPLTVYCGRVGPKQATIAIQNPYHVLRVEFSSVTLVQLHLSHTLWARWGMLLLLGLLADSAQVVARYHGRRCRSVLPGRSPCCCFRDNAPFTMVHVLSARLFCDGPFCVRLAWAGSRDSSLFWSLASSSEHGAVSRPGCASGCPHFLMTLAWRIFPNMRPTPAESRS